MFKKGKSGNPKGRPKGSTNKRGIVAQAFEQYKLDNNVDAKDALITSLINQALGGDTAAAKILIERIEPAFRPVSRVIDIDARMPKDLVKKAEKMLSLALNGSIAADEAKLLLSGLSDLMKVKEFAEIEQRIEELENAQAKQ